MAFYFYAEEETREEDSDEEETIIFQPLTPDMGSYVFKQEYPCAEGDEECSSSVEPHQEINYVM